MNTRDAVTEVLEQLCPMFVLLDGAGRIERVGPTLEKLRPDVTMQGQYFLELFELSRPRAVTTMQGLLARSGAKLHLKFRDAPRTELKGLIVPSPVGAGAVVNLSFGISVLDAVRDYALSSSDFSPTDLTIELLYLVEAKSAAMEASRKLNIRLQGAMIAAEEQAYSDTLTGLRNRRALDFVLGRAVVGNERFALMHLDLDFFKQVNDTLGHGAGDHVLQSVARTMLEEVREADTVARVGGDEFVILFDRMIEKARLSNIAQKLIDKISAPIRYKGQLCEVSVSIGTTLSPEGRGAVSAEDMLHRADVALYAAKRAGRAMHKFYDPRLESEGGTVAGPEVANAKSGRRAEDRRI